MSTAAVQRGPITGSFSEDWVLFRVLGGAQVAQEGCVCRKCNSKNEYAEPNQKDGTYVCYECR